MFQSKSKSLRATVMSLTALSLLVTQPGLAQAPATTGGAKDGARPSKVMLKGEVRYCVPQGTPFKLKLSAVPTNGMHMLNRDLEGNLAPAQLGQQITAKLTEDIYVDDNKVIPEGTVFYGEVSKIHGPRRVYRPGWLEISFDHLVTPDGKKFAFTAEANNFKKSTAGTKLHGAGIIAAHGAGGAIVGAMVAYQLFGWENTVACKGYNIAGGAAGGALIAMGYAVMRRGPKAVLEPGDDLNLAIDTDLLMPLATEPTIKRPFTNLDGLEITIDKCKTKKDNIDGHLKVVDLTIDNNTEKYLNSIDLFVEDNEGGRHAVCAGMAEDSQMLFRIEPHSLQSLKVSFRVEFPKMKYSLIWLDHKSRRVCYRQALPI